MTTDEQLKAATDKAARAERYRQKLLIIKTAEAEIPGIWDTGQVPLRELAAQYSISTMTVRRILQDSGREITRFRKLSVDERAEIVHHLKQGLNQEEIANSYHVSRATVRRIGVEGGVIDKGQRKPRRSDEDYLLIKAYDAECRARFNGAGLYNLGMGLRTWEAKKRSEAAALKHANEAQETVPSSWPDEPVPQFVPAEPIREPSPAPAQSSEPVPEPVVFGDGVEDAAAVVGPFADQAKTDKPFNF